MSSTNASSPPAKRARANSSADATAQEPPTSPQAVNKRAWTTSVEGHDASRLANTNRILGKQVSRMKKTIQDLKARIAQLERNSENQLKVIRETCGDEVLELVRTAVGERSSSQESGSGSHESTSQEEEEQESHEDEGEADTTT